MSEGTHIRFVEQTPNPKTKRWSVETKDGYAIGNISWYGPWRKYCFFPWPNTLYEEVCLREIATFCEQKTQAHKAEKQADKTTGIA